MDDRMTLERLVHEYRPTMDSEVLHSWAADMAAAVTAHLTQPAQAVDVGAVREVIAELRSYRHLIPSWRRLANEADKLTRAIGNAQEEACVRWSTDAIYEARGRFELTGDEMWLPTPPTQATPNAHE